MILEVQEESRYPLPRSSGRENQQGFASSDVDPYHTGPFSINPSSRLTRRRYGHVTGRGLNHMFKFNISCRDEPTPTLRMISPQQSAVSAYRF
jgi:hypothetical protein